MTPSGGQAIVFYSDIPPGQPASAAVMSPNFNTRYAVGTASSISGIRGWGDYKGAGLDPSPNNSGYVYGIADRDVNGYETWETRVTANGLAP